MCSGSFACVDIDVNRRFSLHFNSMTLSVVYGTSKDSLLLHG